jgi:hypothetical protein
MQPCFDPTRSNMEEDLNIFENRKQPQFLKMEDDLNFPLGNLWS